MKFPKSYGKLLEMSGYMDSSRKPTDKFKQFLANEDHYIMYMGIEFIQLSSTPTYRFHHNPQFKTLDYLRDFEMAYGRWAGYKGVMKEPVWKFNSETEEAIRARGYFTPLSRDGRLYKIHDNLPDRFIAIDNFEYVFETLATVERPAGWWRYKYPLRGLRNGS